MGTDSWMTMAYTTNNSTAEAEISSPAYLFLAVGAYGGAGETVDRRVSGVRTLIHLVGSQ